MKKIISTAGLIALAVAGLGGLGPVAEAGSAPAPAPADGDIEVVINASGPAATDILAAITPQLTDPSGGAVPAASCSSTPATSSVTFRCTDQLTTDLAGTQRYVFGVAGLPSSAAISGAACPTATPSSGVDTDTSTPAAILTFPHRVDPTTCFVDIRTLPAIHLDTVVIGGTATPSDFTFDVVAGGGATVATGVADPVAAACTIDTLPFDAEPTDCSSTRTAEGTYSIAPNTIPPSYVATGFACVTDAATTGTQDVTGTPGATEPGAFTHDPVESTGTICTMTYTYVTQQLSVDVVVVNDNGGTAGGADFTIEVRDASNAIVASGTDPEPGTGNASAVFTLPLGEYTITVTGPDGYTVTVVTTVVDRAADLAADAFSLTATQTVAGVVTADDDPPPTTTTTVAPTTTFPVAELPATGSSDSTLPITLVAVFFVVFGAGAVVTTRRR